jgi:hypothetical protein
MLAREIIRLSDQRKVRTPTSPWAAAERENAPYPHHSARCSVCPIRGYSGEQKL